MVEIDKEVFHEIIAYLLSKVLHQMDNLEGKTVLYLNTIHDRYIKNSINIFREDDWGDFVKLFTNELIKYDYIIRTIPNDSFKEIEIHYNFRRYLH